MWALGVLLYTLVAGELPFAHSNPIQINVKINSCDYEFKKDVLERISKDCKQFIERLLDPVY